ncbi:MULTISPECIES: integration host factor, actinobacterial type [Amycolatopsis]|uniref:Integration host factor-like helix-two turn-helix domain-containing protein n=1 Tax=Amycolatopsis bullii TaxID=941987 RepID=A0ABQ3KJB5_9PSEU|nr:integration host factor, actinobacterial type [Amycolatopsis bullii]GHG30088.1 hypothetical protein GCM10017567_57420 [Amycolatopsis bullii]
MRRAPSSAEARTVRAELLLALKTGRTKLTDVLHKSDIGDEVVKKTKVLAVVKALPGIGAVRARHCSSNPGIAGSLRIGGLGPRQREALLSATS